MNECFLIGKVMTDIDFKFILYGKNDSVAQFEVMLQNSSIIKIEAYDYFADYSYRILELNDYVFINGYLNKDMEVVSKVIYKIR